MRITKQRQGNPDHSNAGQARRENSRQGELRRIREALSLTPQGEALLQATDAAEQRTAMELGSASTMDTGDLLGAGLSPETRTIEITDGSGTHGLEFADGLLVGYSLT